MERAKNCSITGLSDLEIQGANDDENNIYMMNPKKNSYNAARSSIKTSTAYNYNKNGKLSTRPTSSGLYLKNKKLTTCSSHASASKVFKGRPLTAQNRKAMHQ